MKKLFNLALASFMFVATIATSGMGVFAAGEGSITVYNTPSETAISIEGKVFGAYRIFDVTVDGEGNVTSYAIAENFEGFFAGVLTGGDTNSYDFSDEEDLYRVENALTFVESYLTDMITFSDLLKEYVDDNGIEANYKLTGTALDAQTQQETAVVTGVDLGYYIVTDTTINPSSGDIVVAGMIDTVTGDLDIRIKSYAPTVDKKIKDNDDDSWQNVADNQIGDDVEFLLIGTIPKSIAEYENYSYVMTDVLSEGLVFNDDIVVYTDAELTKELSTDLYTISAQSDGGFKINFKVQEIIDLKATHVYVNYTALLTSDAVIAGDANTNEVTLEFSNNPYDESDKGTSFDKVFDYTFELNVFKTTANGTTALAGATFAIFEVNGDEEVQLDLLPTAEVGVYTVGGAGLGTITTDDSGLFSIAGLDDTKTYRIKEVAAPSGYNAIDPIDFVITATYDVDNTLETLTTDCEYISADGSLSITIRNTSNSLLPETGGMGTVIFYGAGAAIMAGAAVLFVKSRKEEK